MTGVPIRVVSYNIRKAVGLDWRRDPGRILDVLNRLGGDVVLLQEADRRLGERRAALPRELIASASDFTVAPLAVNEVSLGWHGNAVLLRKGVVARRVARIALPALEPRGAVRVDVETPTGELTVIGAHLGLARRWRRRQIRTILDAIEEDRKAESVVAGDFNEWSTTTGMEAFAGTHDVLSPGKTFHATRPVAALDRIALGRAVALVGAGVDETPEARSGSDHLPIWADLSGVGRDFR